LPDVAKKQETRMDALVRVVDEDLHCLTMQSPQIAIVAPSFNERANIRPFVASIASALRHYEWEMIIVDDDSPDGTYQEVLEIVQINPRVRGLRRIGRKGLASAVIEGILASNAPVVAVMDADLQHDEAVLPAMFARILEGVDLVVGTRYSCGGSVGTWSKDRVRMSRIATVLSRILIGSRTSDPMSGFFMARRQIVNNCVHDLSQQGYKILLDLIASSPESIRIEDVAYTFRERSEGVSKLTAMVVAEFFFLVVEKLTRGLLPPRFALFAIVGLLGLAVHLSILNLVGAAGWTFIQAQIVATVGAVIFNFTLNNQFTFRDRRLTGTSMFVGLVLFSLACSVGALANVSVADLAQKELGNWNLSGMIGALMGSVFNFGIASSVVWNRRGRRRALELARTA
jgi:dolichol-phosphate mannosyltransferase